MTVKVENGGSFANGFEYFCAGCGNFFSAQIKDVFGDSLEVSWCPCCSGDDLREGTAGLLAHCDSNYIDPVNFYSAFPPDEPLPRSCTGATPEQAERIINCVINGRREKLPVTACNIADLLGYDREIVAAVFDELHL